ncbi:gp020 [Rhodococcus phage ReqiPepy6]|uniref:Gp020 n=1 Tax=Rhodococcus phage ReqiPepy6 TaxID=691965 RepID=D4P7D1_9CAUD|nr:gp020 [Rhodococcus phage ReqiPepy6]ADD80911.1 gp020 [Rhodococcus phage ReqiPepy6]
MTAVVEIDDFLAHYGVKGMKWGVIRDRDSGSRSSGSGTSGPVRTRQSTALEAKYIQKGHDLETAQQKAAKRAKVQKVLLVAGAVTLAGTAAYVGHKEYGKRFTNVVLEKGADLKYINALGPQADYNRRLYTTFNEGDTKKYRGMLAKQLQKNGLSSKTIYETTLRATETIKAPSHREAEKIYKDLIKRKDIYPKEYGRMLSYKEFNAGLIRSSADGKEFYNALKKKGFNAVLDSNDQFVSGYNTKKPLILFNAASSTVKTGEKIVEQKTIDGLYARQVAGVMARQFAPVAAVGAAAVGAHKYIESKNKYAVVNKYLDEHPNSKRSPAEIYASLQVQPNGLYEVPDLTAVSKPPKKGGSKK